MKRAILVVAILLFSTPLHAEMMTVTGTANAVWTLVLQTCLSHGHITTRVGDQGWIKCGDYSEFTIVESGDSVTVTGHGPMVQVVFDWLKLKF